MNQAAQRIQDRIDALALISEDPHQITRTFASPAMRRANELVSGWMREAGMSVREDAIGNLIGRYEGATAKAKTLLIGSHLDTVRNAGRFDGPLGVIIGIACVEELYRSGTRLPFAIEVVGFCDEEGVRYQSTYLGSRVLAGSFIAADLKRIDAHGVTLADAIRRFGGKPEAIGRAGLNPKNLVGYVEVHIEQGPVLETQKQAVGIVSAIAGQTRAKLSFNGMAGHAGTTPMSLRHDALAAAAQFILAVEQVGKGGEGLVATVGQIHNAPNASNVIPSEVVLTVDVRHQRDAMRTKAVKQIRASAGAIGKKRQIKVSWETVQETLSVACDPGLMKILRSAAFECQSDVLTLASGAGHDAAVMGKVTPAAMLFVRCRKGLSHHPDEFASVSDIGVTLDVMNRFLARLASRKL